MMTEPASVFWLWTDNGGQWRKFEKQSNYVSTDSDTIENEFQKGMNPKYYFKSTNQKITYCINFEEMTQTNLKTKKIRPVKREDSDAKPDQEHSQTTEGASCSNVREPFTDSHKIISDCLPLDEVIVPCNHHTVLFSLPLFHSDVPMPYHSTTCTSTRGYESRVQMPWANAEKWKEIEVALLTEMKSLKDLETSIATYNTRMAENANMEALQCLFDNATIEERSFWLERLIPAMARLALRLPDLLPKPIPLLKRQRNHSISISQLQIASLLANAFFSTFSEENRKGSKASLPSINFLSLFRGDANTKSTSGITRNREKLRCFLNYFSRVVAEEPKGTLTFTRQSIPLDKMPNWGVMNIPLKKIEVRSEGTIEEDGIGMMQLDFADRFLGGLVLQRGCVQEEIRFAICPELVAGMIWSEVMENNEAIIITGCEQYSSSMGYANSFKWKDNFVDKTSVDKSHRRKVQIVAIDAIPFKKSAEQYDSKNVLRELNKAFAGFYRHPDSTMPFEDIATGNWGCGAFRGDPHLKCLLQQMAADICGRKMVYFTFNDKKLGEELSAMNDFLVTNNVTIGSLWKLLCNYNEEHVKESQENQSKMTLYEYLYKQIGENSTPTNQHAQGC